MKLDLESYTMPTKEYGIRGEFINRELSWLAFNERVLFCANDKALPINERFKFLAITCSNLDEFIAVRFSQYRNDDKLRKEILESIKYQMLVQKDCYDTLRSDAKKLGKDISSMSNLNKHERDIVRERYQQEIFPLLTPVYIGSSEDLPAMYNGQSMIALIVRNAQLENLILIPIPKYLPKLYHVGKKIVQVEDIVLYYINDLCVNKQVTQSGYFRINKDFSICLNHDGEDSILKRMSNTIDKRNASDAIFMTITPDMPKTLKTVLLSLFGVSKKNLFDKSFVMDYTRFMAPVFDDVARSYRPFEPAKFEIIGGTHNIYQTLKEQDILLQHPYDSYDTVINFIEQSALDPRVMAIKMTLYRVSSENSPIVDALCTAAKLGKEVTVLIEIKARFDESQNIALVDKLRHSGVRVVLGFEHLKTHCKMCVVARQEGRDIKIYSHIATGNYNEKTAKQYTDLSYLTSKTKIGTDLLNIFNILSGVSTPDDGLQRVFYAPLNLRKRLLKNIDREIQFAKKGKKAEIFLKLNSISDIEMVNKLYEAADKGVEIYIICRGICSIVPRENIYIKSIVGRFLEHSRIYYFRNGGNDEYYISSADLLTRNLDRRIEILFLVKDASAIKKLKHMMKVFKEDRRNSFKMNEHGNYLKLPGDFDCHQWFINKSSERPKIGKK